MKNILTELKRRSIFRVIGVYAISAWVLAQLAGVLESSMNLPTWFDTVVVSFLLIGFPIAIILAWAFEMTPEGIKRTTNAIDDAGAAHKSTGWLDYVLIAGFVLVAGLVIGDRILPKNTAAPDSNAITGDVQTLTGQSIAVLPFEDFSPNKDQAYFADGIAEELLNVLARVDGLRVASRTSAFTFRDRQSSIAEIAQALNVNHILEGSVRKAGDTLRITAQLIDTKTDEHMWSETYDRPLTAENIFVIQDEISKAIVLELNGRLDLLPETDERLTQSTEALEAYLKGKEAYGPRSAEGLEIGITELIRAVTLDPEFAVAHAKLARAYVLASNYAELEKINAYPRAQIHIQRAQEMAPDDWDVLSEYAWFLETKRSDFGAQYITIEQVLAAFDAAIAANPNNAEAHRGKGWSLDSVGRLEEAKASLELAKELNPREPLVYLNLTDTMEKLGDWDASINFGIQAVRLNPTASLSLVSLGSTYRDTGEVVTAHRIFQSCRTDDRCARRLGSIFTDLGIDSNDPKLQGPYTLLTKHYLAGDYDQFATTVKTLNGTPIDIKAQMYGSVGFWDEAYQLIQDNPSVFKAFLLRSAAIDSRTLSNEINLLATLEHHNDPRAKTVRASLSNKYQSMVPGQQNKPETYVNGAKWSMLESDPDGAMTWLNAFADRGKSYFLYNHALFKPLETRADYQAYVARMESYRDRDRALIQAQLANPPAVWWSPDESAEKKE